MSPLKPYENQASGILRCKDVPTQRVRL